MSAENLPVLTSDTFEAYIAEHDGIILFHKKLCPHCKVLGTVLDKVAAQMPNIAMASVDSEDEPALMTQVGAERVPTVAAVKGGKVKAIKTGVMNPREMIAFYQGA